MCDFTGWLLLHAFNHEFAGHLKHSCFWAKKVREEEDKRVTITTQIGLFTCDLESFLPLRQYNENGVFIYQNSCF